MKNSQIAAGALFILSIIAMINGDGAYDAYLIAGWVVFGLGEKE